MNKFNSLIDSFFNILKNIFGEGLLYQTVTALFIFFLFISVGYLIKFILSAFDKKFKWQEDTKFKGTLFSIANKSILPIFTILGAFISLDDLIDGLAKRNILSREILTNIYSVIFVLLVILLVRVAVKITKFLIEYGLSISATRHNEIIDESRINSFNRIISILLYTIGLSIILRYFGQSIASVLTLLGLGSIAIGLAAQETISNMIAGFVIMFDRPFKVGNRIKLPSGEEGDIFEMGIRSTKILDFDNNLVIIPNAELMKARIVNFAYPEESTRIVIDFSVPFETNIENVKNICIEIMKSESELQKKIPPEVWLMDLKGSGLHFRAFCRAKSFKQNYKIAESIRIKIHNELYKNKISIVPMDKNIIISPSAKK